MSAPSTSTSTNTTAASAAAAAEQQQQQQQQQPQQTPITGASSAAQFASSTIVTEVRKVIKSRAETGKRYVVIELRDEEVNAELKELGFQVIATKYVTLIQW